MLTVFVGPWLLAALPKAVAVAAIHVYIGGTIGITAVACKAVITKLTA